jgi:phosphoglycerate dehydrogenase-like enzyme
MKIIADANIPFIQEYFDGYGELILKPGRLIKQADLRDADMLLVRSITHVDEALLANTNVKFVGSVTAGADHLDTKWLDQAGILWSVAAGFNAPPVADYVVSSVAALQVKGLLKGSGYPQMTEKLGYQKNTAAGKLAHHSSNGSLASGSLRLTCLHDEQVFQQQCFSDSLISQSSPAAARSRQLTAAVIGLGNVGRLVAEKLKLLGFEVALCDPIRAQQESDFISTPLQELSDVDLISLHVPLIKTGEHPTYHFIDKDFLSKQKPGCVLLNASRGAVIHSNDLLEYGRHLHWCLDVWEDEPRIDKQILEQACIATPHIAGYSVQSKIRGIEMIYRIACDKNIIEPKPISPIVMPKQRLNFVGREHHWQEIVLGVFNPMVITDMMRTLLLPSDNEELGHVFDEMRNQFNYRYEFGYTNIANAEISASDGAVLAGLNFKLKDS